MITKVKLNLREKVNEIKKSNKKVYNFYDTLLSRDNEFIVDSFKLFKYESFYCCFKVIDNDSFLSHYCASIEDLVDEIQFVNNYNNDISLMINPEKHRIYLTNNEIFNGINNDIQLLKEGYLLQDIIIINKIKYVFQIEPVVLHNNLFIGYHDDTNIIFNDLIHCSTTSIFTIIYKCCFNKVYDYDVYDEKKIHPIYKPLLKDIKNTLQPIYKPLLKDDELIKLFDNTPKEKKIKKLKKKSHELKVIDISTEDIIVEETFAEIFEETIPKGMR